MLRVVEPEFIEHFNIDIYMSDTLLCREKADELCRTQEENEDKSHTASKMADVMYHVMVFLTLKNVKTEKVLEVLRQRFSKSGI